MTDEAPDPFAKLRQRAAARDVIVDQIARMFWESGEELADTEGGTMPTWDEVCANLDGSGGDENFTQACCDWWLSHKHRAEAVLALDATQSLALANILIAHAQEQHRRLELDLWRKIERAKGFEAGSLTGAPDVKQQVAL